jgi:hypothetical protein
MRQSLHVPIAPGRKVGAWVCLLAVALLWSPLWAAAWHTHGMDCCSDGFCPMHGHPKTDRAGSSEEPPSEQPVERDHLSSTQNHRQKVDCAVSCCHESGANLMAAMIFVLPAPTTISQPAQAIVKIAKLAPASFAQASEPLSPPPRTL